MSFCFCLKDGSRKTCFCLGTAGAFADRENGHGSRDLTAKGEDNVRQMTVVIPPAEEYARHQRHTHDEENSGYLQHDAEVPKEVVPE